MKTVIEMALHSGDDEWKILVKQVMKHFPDEFERFVELVRADERNATLEEIAKWLEGEKDAPYWAELVRARSNT
jgi:hypothetical protein